jgi:LPXTG-motif cell wall-anchored protein
VAFRRSSWPLRRARNASVFQIPLRSPTAPTDEADNVQYGPDDAQYKTAPPTVTDLPKTGGSVSLIGAMVPLALLVGGGLLAFRTVRRS